MSANTSTTPTEPIELVEKVELRHQNILLSDLVTAKQERHYSSGKLNNYTFDLSGVETALFERALVGDLDINGIISATITNTTISLDGNRSVTVEFWSGL